MSLTILPIRDHLLTTGPNAWRTLEERFWLKVDMLGSCWEWRGKILKNGYGCLPFHKSYFLTHRVSWELSHDYSPGDLEVCHSCDNRRCVFPGHLFLGTQLDNMRDAVNKGRMNTPRGEDSGNSKLTWQDVREIRRLRVEHGLLHKEIASRFRISTKQVTVILNNQQWKEDISCVSTVK